MASLDMLMHRHIYKYLHQPAIIIAGFFVSVSLFLSLLLTFQHLSYYTKPSEQKWIVAIIFMVPVYATESILSLWDANLSFACNILRSCYEAFALYSFGSYLIECLGGEAEAIKFLEDKSSEESSSKPLLEWKENLELRKRTFHNFIFRPHLLGKDLLNIIKFGLVQYMILKTFCAFLALTLELGGAYGDGKFEWYYGYPYITVVLNFSQMWALYCLVKFYNAIHLRLESIRPLEKFISFKAIVFATWWQGLIIVLLCTFGVLPKQGKFQTGLQDFLICIEMAIAAVAHIFVFSAKPYHYIHAPPDYEHVATDDVKTGEYGKADGGDDGVESPGTSITESVHNLVVEGGHKVVKDVVLTLNQAIEPVHGRMVKIQENFNQTSKSDDRKGEINVRIEEHEKTVERKS